MRNVFYKLRLSLVSEATTEGRIKKIYLFSSEQIRLVWEVFCLSFLFLTIYKEKGLKPIQEV
jgi:hypothetical protein